MKQRCHHRNVWKYDFFEIYLKGRYVTTLKTKDMAIISIDIEDNAAEFATLVTNFQHAFTALQNSTLTGLPAALADLETAEIALASFQISFTASVVQPAL